MFRLKRHLCSVLAATICLHFGYQARAITPGEVVSISQTSEETNANHEKLWSAARAGDSQLVKQLLEQGVDVNSATHYGSTALTFACDRGHLEVVKILLDAGADATITDSFYKATPLDWAQMNGHYDAMALLLSAGAKGADRLLMDGVTDGNAKLVAAVLKSEKATPKVLVEAKLLAQWLKSEAILPLLESIPLDDNSKYKPTSEQVKRFEGSYASDQLSLTMLVSVEDDLSLMVTWSTQSQKLMPVAENEFALGNTRMKFIVDDGNVTQVVRTIGENSLVLVPGEAKPATASTDSESNEDTEETPLQTTVSAADVSVSSVNWPSFRGTGSRGIADGQNPPVVWDAESGQNLLWKTAIPGLGNSCPVIWGDQLFVTSASSQQGDTEVKIGLYGDVESVEDDQSYDFSVYCLNKTNGEVVWKQTAHSGKPAVKRHSKSSHANSTIATNGKYLIAFFGSEGLYCFDLSGKLIWKRDLGFLDSGWFFNPDYQWGFGSSPIISGDRVFIQCDIQKGSFVAALELATGQEVWHSNREEIPTWSTPTFHQFGDIPMLVTHGTRAARGYDARDGKLLWSIPDHSEIVTPTPQVAHGLIYLTSGYSPVQPIVAVKPSARGEVRLPGRGEEKNANVEGIAWSHLRGGPYMPTPIVYGDYLYTCANNGVITCYQANSGKQIYKKRLPDGGTLSFTGSPVAADGHLYFPCEDGRVFVVQAGQRFKLISTNASGGKMLTSPAISNGCFFVRTTDSLLAFGQSEN